MTIVNVSEAPTTRLDVPGQHHDSSSGNGNGGGGKTKESRKPFPCKVYDMLEDAMDQGFDDIVSWHSSGNGFMVHNKDKFTKDIIPLYFNQTKYKSFQRQLSLYGFERITAGKDKGLRHHAKLLRGNRQLCKEMKPIGYKPRGTLVDKTAAAAKAGGNNVVHQTCGSSSPAPGNTTTMSTLHQQRQGGNTPRSSVPSATVKNQVVVSTTGTIPAVISSSSLNKDATNRAPGGLHEEIRHISPDTTPMKAVTRTAAVEVSSDEYSTSSSGGADDHMGCFEGMSFYLMDQPNPSDPTPPTDVLCCTPFPATPLQHPSNIITNEQLISSLPASVLTTTARIIPAAENDIPTLPPAVVTQGAQQLKKAWEIGFAVAMTMESSSSQESDDSPPPPLLDAAAWNLIDIPSPGKVM